MHLPLFIEAYIVALLPPCIARQVAQRRTLATVNKPTTTTQRIFVDISVFAKHDAGTGIQRVVREVLKHLVKSTDGNFTFIPVAATRRQGYCQIDFPQSNPLEKQDGKFISLSKGDIFLGLDLSAHILPRHRRQLLQWKRAGASIQIVVYDLLPALHPQWFNPKSVKNYKKWIKTLSIFADRFHCISETVKLDLMSWIKMKYGISLSEHVILVFPLGSNLGLENSENKNSITHDTHDAVLFAQTAPTFLMVGTIEPRKGHAEVIRAFIESWEKGAHHQLVIVGTPGWKTEIVQEKLVEASKKYKKVLWLRNANDILLTQLYRSAHGVIVASEGEGYGLPLVEAAYFGKPVLARDIPVFREIAQGSVTFFPDDAPLGLEEKALTAWMSSCENNNKTTTNFDPPRWEATAKVLLSNMATGQCA